MADNSGLDIYKASAGSGKTFRLVGEYLKMLFAHPNSYRHILAVTFTNKATAEMKERILNELSNLSSGSASKYVEFLQEYGNERRLREKAKSILNLVLHDYSRFSVMTIDSFFQRVIRSFAREIRLNASFRTEIDNQQALEDAVDLLFQDIEENELLRSWMVMFMEENLEEGRSWDFKSELMRFAREAEKEAFKVHGDELLEMLEGKEKLSEYIARMKEIISEAELRLTTLGQQGLNIISGYGLTYDQFKNGKNSFANIFNKMAKGNFDPPTSTMLNAADQLENWFKKSDPAPLKAQVEQLYYNGLNSLLKESLQAFAVETQKINSARAILKNIYPFGLLGNIALKIRKVLSENNTLLLSDSGTLIGKIIEGNDTPFIYEYVVTIYHHFMLDEFQDTSRQQWSNFRPLVENSLAMGNSSLVVGDVKQSIYRWRNGDWNLLANQLSLDMKHQVVANHDLNVNWRSKRNIVDFNNTLFWRAARFLNDWFDSESADQPFSDLTGVIAGAYADQFQKCANTGTDQGFVKILFADAGGAMKKSEFREQALLLLIGQLESVQKSGVKAEDITILVRENSEAEKVARALWNKKKTDPQPGCSYDVITSDTLRIGQSPVVRFVTDFFKFFLRRETQLMRAEILYLYYRILTPKMDQKEVTETTGLHELFDAATPLPELFVQWLDDDPQSEFLTGLLAMPLYELAVAVADHFHLVLISGEKVYLQAFLDLILEYGRERSGGISGFLEWWEVSGSKKTLNLTVIKDFIRISSIHQSKGLEYQTVFIPFCDWEIAFNSNKIPYIWSIPEEEPYNLLKIVLLKCDRSLKNSIFSHDYYREMLLSIMDNLNLLYVATTRAINHLFFIMPYKDDIKQVNTVADLIQKLVENPVLRDSIEMEKYLDFGEYWDPSTKIFESGKMVSIPALDPSEQTMREVRPNEPLTLNSNSKRMEIRLHSKDYFQLTGNQRTERINKGTVIHQIFEKITTGKDLEPAVNQMVASGVLNVDEGRELSEKIDALIRVKPFSEWFDGRWKVFNERDILRVGEKRHRPDRVLLRDNFAVVIDYKTGEKSEKDIRQMKGYLADLVEMGYTSCEGNIWYLKNNEIVKVEK